MRFGIPSRTLLRSMPAFLLFAMASLLPPAATAQGPTPAATGEKPLPTDVVLPDVPEKSDPAQTFALYLPPEYSAAKRWPVIYAFDWAARGKVPAELLYPAARKLGYIVIGSNNSRNGSAKESLEAALALWRDARARFSIDEHQVYATGFSGASRSAFVFADQCGCVQGVIAVGAGLPALAGPLRGLSYGVFMTLGVNDFNYPELVELEQVLDSLHVPNRLRRFDGDHQWPPAEILAEGVDWLQLEAMRQGRRPKDEAFIAGMSARSLERAEADEKAGDLLSAYEEYRKSAEEFAGIGDAAPFASRAAAMKVSPDLQKSRKQEREDIARQKRLVGDVEQQLASLPPGSVEVTRRASDIKAMAGELRDSADNAKNPRDVRVARRAVSDVFAMGYEGGLTRFRQGDMQGAEVYFEVAATVGPKSPGPPFELAKIYARSGDKKHAMRSLELAVSKGLKNPALLRDTADFASLRGEARFQELVAQLEQAQAQTSSPH